MDQIHQRRRDQRELELGSPVIPIQQRRLIDDETDTDLPGLMPVLDESALSERDLLSERERGILDFEKQWWRHAGAKEQAIRETFEVSGTRYYQILNSLLDNPAALEHDPVLVGRLRRLRGSRSRARGRGTGR